jgi:ribosomal protein L40E
MEIPAIGVFLDFPMLSIFVTLVAFYVIFRSVRVMQKQLQRPAQLCSTCKVESPAEAKFCRRCGQRLA